MAITLESLQEDQTTMQIRMEALETLMQGFVAKETYKAFVTLVEKDIDILKTNITAIQSTVSSHTTILSEEG